ncbi:sialic acid-binding Ig-like lectin 14 [Mobula birostris]|uniref:sialic acid-binding Ig-like lectin 14 n=1 Tax=Mobula birostris TaxID=1983395 RepID=UPI003B27F94F
MQLFLKLLFLLQALVQGVPVLLEVNQPRLVSVGRGESVTLNCRFTHNATEDSWVIIFWYRTSPRAADAFYKVNNSHCVFDACLHGLKHCNASLKVEHVSFGHSGNRYSCILRIPSVYPPLEARGQGTQLQVYEPPEISVLDGPLVADNESVLNCSGNGLLAEDISFTWACSGTSNFTEVAGPTLWKNNNGTSVVTSQLKLVPRVEDHGSVCSCQIDHATFRQPIKIHIKLNVMYGPHDSIITYKLNTMDNYLPINHSEIIAVVGSSLALNCCMTSNPASTVMWTRVRESPNGTLQTNIGLNCAKVQIHFQSEDEGIYWCMAYNDYGSRNTSIWIKANHETNNYYQLYAVLPITTVIIMTIMFFWLICKRQRKDPVNVSTELSSRTMDRSASCGHEIDTVYAVVRKKSQPTNRQHPTEATFVDEGNSEEEVSYADIVIHSPKRVYNQKLKQAADVTEKNTKQELQYFYGSSPHHQVDDTSEYSAVRIPRQDLITA